MLASQPPPPYTARLAGAPGQVLGRGETGSRCDAGAAPATVSNAALEWARCDLNATVHGTGRRSHRLSSDSALASPETGLRDRDAVDQLAALRWATDRRIARRPHAVTPLPNLPRCIPAGVLPE